MVSWCLHFIRTSHFTLEIQRPRALPLTLGCMLSYPSHAININFLSTFGAFHRLNVFGLCSSNFFSFQSLIPHFGKERKIAINIKHSRGHMRKERESDREHAKRLNIQHFSQLSTFLYDGMVQYQLWNRWGAVCWMLDDTYIDLYVCIVYLCSFLSDNAYRTVTKSFNRITMKIDRCMEK